MGESRHRSITKLFCAGTLALSLLAVFAPAALARTAAELERALGPGVEVQRDARSGDVGFVGTRPGRPIELGPSSPRRAALELTDRLAPELEVDSRRSDLEAVEVDERAARTTVRLAQSIDGLPVIGGELNVNLDPAGDGLSLSGETTDPGGVGTEPTVPLRRADDAAFAAVADEHGVDPATLRASGGELSIYDPVLLGGPEAGPPRVVWQFEVSSTERLDIRQLVLVDARSGKVALSFNQIADALDRDICDGANVPGAQFPCSSPVREDSGPGGAGPQSDSLASTVPGDVDTAYEFAGDTYEFYAANHGRDSLDDAGMTIVSTADYCEPGESCPYDNAFWDGEQMAYGDGFAAADDVVGHELTHGVTDFSSRLFYYYQSGAISESLSDIWGEFIDLGNGAGSDTPADRWLIGEDLPGIGPLRDMADPGAFGDPDRMSSPSYFAGPGDSGGVHFNSGVGNKAAYLMVDGGSFNGVTVTGIGITKTAKVFYEAQTGFLTTGADYADLRNALTQGCSNLVASGETTGGDCQQVQAATDAVEMGIDPPAATVISAPEAACPVGGETLTTSFFDDLEDPAVGNWVPLTDTGDNAWVYDEPPVQTYVHSGQRSLYGGLLDGSVNDYSFGLARSTEVERGSTLRFDHAFDFSDGSGGVVEASTDGGNSWTDLGPMFEFAGSYIAPITGADNPLQGRDGFTGESKGYGASAIDLGSLGGSLVKLRFRIGTGSDSSAGLGWVVDDIQIYSCVPETSISAGPDDGATIAEVSPTFSVDNSSASGGGIEVSIDGSPLEAPTTAQATAAGFTTGSLADGRHTVVVRAVGSGDAVDPTPVIRRFTVDTAVDDADATAQKKQKQKGKRIKVKLKVGAQEAVEVAGSGVVKVGKRNYKLKPKAKALGAGQAKVLRLKPARKKHGNKIAKALGKRKKVRAPVGATFTDAVGNTLTEKRVVRLKGKPKKPRKRR